MYFEEASAIISTLSYVKPLLMNIVDILNAGLVINDLPQ